MAEQQKKLQDPKATFTAGVTEAKIWRVTNQPDPQAAADWLNRTPAQQAGEAFASNRSDGTVDVYGFF